MAEWHRTRGADLGLRLLGAGLCALAWLAIAGLVVPQAPPILACARGAVGFLCGSVGSAMVMLGAHLFDSVRVSARWRSRRSS